MSGPRKLGPTLSVEKLRDSFESLSGQVAKDVSKEVKKISVCMKSYFNHILIHLIELHHS